MFINSGRIEKPKRTQLRNRLLVASGILLFLMTGTAQASLGGNAASVLIDQTALATIDSAASSVSTNAATNSNTATASDISKGYVVKTVAQTSGTAINEYVGNDGTVFAVSWSGPFMPSLRQLLGAYFGAYQTETARLRANTSGHGPLAVDDGELVVQSMGGMHNFFGNAYLKSRLPAGFSLDLLR
jgi:hypothetical protein